ncbi:MAG: HepT-like ribonuclease domain-containing protein [Vulcanimicrobiaceae bacterium]
MPSERWHGRNLEQRAQDVLDSIQAIADFVEGVTEVSFLKDRKTQSAVERELLIISEACTRIREIEERAEVPEEKRLERRFPNVPWAAIRGIGNILRHEYGRVDPRTIWNTVSDGGDLGDLRAAMSKAFRPPR